MVKPRILIVDTDTNYMIPLQQKFIEEFFDRIELEIITDKSYFQYLFSTSQKADVLIISDHLYEESLKRHNIGGIFILKERYEESQTADLNLTFLYKYTNINMILSEIISKSKGVLDFSVEGKRDPQIILVYSANGGAGKTTVALGISEFLSKNYKKVLYINANTIQSFQRLLNNHSVIADNDVLALLSQSTESVYPQMKHVIRKEDFSYLPPFKATLMSVGLRYSIFGSIAVSAKQSKEYDYIILDAESGLDEEKASLLNIADKVILVVNQTVTSMYSTTVFLKNINRLNTNEYIFICNNFVKDQANAFVSEREGLSFEVSEYVNHYDNYDEMSIDDFSKDSGIQKVSLLVL